jgi:hypothetical protein
MERINGSCLSVCPWSLQGENGSGMNLTSLTDSMEHSPS